MSIELVSGVEYPKITTMGLFFEATICGCSVVELFFFCSFLFIFVVTFYFFVSGIFLVVLWETSCVNFFLPVSFTLKLFISSFCHPFELGI